MRSLIKLNLGCGMRPLEGHVNVDCEPSSKADVVADLECAWPFDDASVDEIVAIHVMEHIRDLKTFMQQAYRVAKPGAKMYVVVPHHTHEFFWGDPTHVRPITKVTLGMFSKEASRVASDAGYANTPLALYWDIDFKLTEVRFVLDNKYVGMLDEDEASTMDFISKYNNVVQEMCMTLECVKD